MTYQRFEDLPVWQEAIRLAERVYALTEDAAFQKQYSLRDQLERAAVSVSNNIAEGFERGTTNELLAFLYIARGSAGEVRSMLCLLERIGRFGHLKSEISNLKSSAESCSRQLRAWAGNLQDSPIEGQRRLTTAGRRETEQQKKAAAFTKMLKEKFKPAPFPNPPKKVEGQGNG
ncbi:MAG: four helix bundle protein [Verrucomicrobia bacterium]|nr:four helix bundle protein [Verrucomicrobiota bacterium]